MVVLCHIGHGIPYFWGFEVIPRVYVTKLDRCIVLFCFGIVWVEVMGPFYLPLAWFLGCNVAHLELFGLPPDRVSDHPLLLDDFLLLVPYKLLSLSPWFLHLLEKQVDLEWTFPLLLEGLDDFWLDFLQFWFLSEAPAQPLVLEFFCALFLVVVVVVVVVRIWELYCLDFLF